jgi:hypothetical protein
METYIKKAIGMAILTSVAGVAGVMIAPNTASMVVFAIVLLGMHFLGLAILGYLEIKAEFFPKQQSWASRFESKSLALSDSE